MKKITAKRRKTKKDFSPEDWAQIVAQTKRNHFNDGIWYPNRTNTNIDNPILSQ